jgi:hypothetical protein
MTKPLTVKNLKNEDVEVWTIDFETYYDSRLKYTLRNKKSTMVQYVRDELFKAHGCSFVSPTGDTGWITHKDLSSFFDSIDWSKSAWLSQNCAFDAFIAHEHYNVKANYYLDTLSMARGDFGPGVRNGLHDLSLRLNGKGKIQGELEKTDGVRDLSPEQEDALVPYAINDSTECRFIFEEMYFTRGYPQTELHVIDLTLKTFVNPVLEIDASLLRAEIEEEDIRMELLLNSDLVKEAQLSDACAAVLRNKGLEGLMRSRPCFAELLLSRGVYPPMKEKKKDGEIVSGEMTYAFAKNDIELINLGYDPRVSDLVATWSGCKSTLRKSRAQRFLDVSYNGTRTLPVPLNYCGGRTHRWSAGGGEDGTSNPFNPQNLSSGRDGRGARLRESIIAPKGYRIAAIDSAQNECRVHAWTWGEMELLDDFRFDRDPYSKLAAEIFGVPVSKTENTHLRFVGKEGELSLGYSVGWKKFFSTIQTKYGLDATQFSEEDAKRVVEFYRAKRTGIVAGWDKLKTFIQLMAAKSSPFEYKMFTFYPDKVFMPNGLAIHYPNLHYRYDKEKKEGGYYYQFKNYWAKIYAGKASENFSQSLGRSIVAEQALDIAKEFQVVLLVHDEVVALVPENDADAAVKYCIECMEKSPSWCLDLPLAAEGKHSHCYSK